MTGSPLHSLGLGLLGLALTFPVHARAEQPIQLRVKKVLCVAPSGPFPGDTMKYVGAAIYGDPEGRVPAPINGMQAPMEYGVPVISMLGPKGQAAAVGLTAGMEGVKQTYQLAKWFDTNRTPDDLYIKVNGQKVWPRGRDSIKIAAGQTHTVGVTAPPAVGGQHRIELWEHDDGFLQGDDDLLGDLGFGTGGGLERTVTFTLSNKSEGSIYLVEVEFFRPPPPPVKVTAVGTARNANANSQMCSFRDNLRSSAPVAGQRSNDLARDLPPVDLTARSGGFGDLRASGLTTHESKYWKSRMDQVRSPATNNVNRAGMAWTWDVPARGITFGRQNVVVPYATQQYRDSNGNARQVRWIAGAPQSTGTTYLELPLEGEFKGDPNPVSMQTLKPWLDCMSPGQRRAVEPRLRQMRARGYLVDTEAEVQMVTRGLTIGERIRMGRSVENIKAAITEGGFQPTTQDLNGAVGVGADDKAVVELLLQLGARPDANTMMRAVKANEPEMIGLLASKGAPIKADHVREAINSEDPALVDVVLQRGGRSIVGLTAGDLKLALDAGDNTLAGKLAAAGAPSDSGTLRQALLTRDAPLISKVAANTPADHDSLALAMDSGNPTLLRTFTGRGARLKDNQPIYRAMARGDLAMVRVGLESGGDAEAFMKHATRRRSSVGIGLAVEAGADPNPAVRVAIQQDDAPLYVDLITVHRADPQAALSTAIALDSAPYAELAISQGRANPTAALPGQVRGGDREWIAFLLDAGADADAGVDAAIDAGSADVLQYLIELGANAGKASHVHLAAEKANLDVLVVVIERGGGKPDDGLDIAVDKDHLEVVEYLIDRGATPTGVHVPAARGKLPMVQLLVSRGADPTEGIEQAVTNSQDAVAVYLLDQGAKTDGMLAIAARNDRMVICRKLLERGASPDDGTEAAAETGRAEILDYLVAEGADVSGPRLMSVGVAKGHAEVVQSLVRHGAAVMHVDAEGDTFVHEASRASGREAVVKVLLDAGVEVDAVNQAGDTALLDAVRVGTANVAVVDLLVSAGADVNARDAEGRIVWKEAKSRKVKKVLKDAGAEKR